MRGVHVAPGRAVDPAPTDDHLEPGATGTRGQQELALTGDPLAQAEQPGKLKSSASGNPIAGSTSAAVCSS